MCRSLQGFLEVGHIAVQQHVCALEFDEVVIEAGLPSFEWDLLAMGDSALCQLLLMLEQAAHPVASGVRHCVHSVYSMGCFVV